MGKIHAAITGVNGFVPEYKLTNKELEKLVETTDEWILTRTGISERRILKGEGLGSSDMALPAVLGLLEKTNTRPEDVEVVIFATVTPDMVFPATANILCDKAGLKNAWGFDLSAACSGFLYGLTTGTRMIESGAHKKIIVIGCDKMSSIVDYSDRTTCIIFGDGCAAVMLEPTSEDLGVMDAIMRSDGAGREYLHQKAGGSVKPASHATVDAGEHFIYQEGKQVFKFAVTNMAEAAAEILERNNLTSDDIAWLVPHQANLRIIDATANRIGMGKEKIMINIQKYGNTTSATIPLCLWEWEKQLKKGDNLVLSAFGGGFTWGALWLKWAYNS
jgi:3-oxoacyl-[acyl-carrier-protein] synthase-3